MANKVFGKGQGRQHFQELAQSNLSNFNMNSYFVEVNSSIEIDDLLDPATWGPQRLVKRGDIFHIMREDNAFYGQFLCESSAAGYPLLRPIFIMRRDASVVSAPIGVGNGIEFHVGAGWLAIAGGDIVAARPTQAEAEAALAEHLNKAAA